MQVRVVTGDLLALSADVLVTTANPYLTMSGGVNGAILLGGGESVQVELRDFLRATGKPHVPPGGVVRTSAGPLNARHLLHAVAVDAFYASSISLVERTINAALDEAVRLQARTVAMPALATGYGPLSMLEFAEAFARAVARNRPPLETVTLVLRRQEDADVVERMVQCTREG